MNIPSPLVPSWVPPRQPRASRRTEKCSLTTRWYRTGPTAGRTGSATPEARIPLAEHPALGQLGGAGQQERPPDQLVRARRGSRGPRRACSSRSRRSPGRSSTSAWAIRPRSRCCASSGPTGPRRWNSTPGRPGAGRRAAAQGLLPVPVRLRRRHGAVRDRLHLEVAAGPPHQRTGPAGVAQTDDWVKIRGDQLAPSDGLYDVRITAELWETHYFDHVALMVVDHPADTEVFVDERFALTPTAAAAVPDQPPHPVAYAGDDQGRDVTDVVRPRRPLPRHLRPRLLPGRRRGPLGRGRARRRRARDGPVCLLAHGWIHPTDSSINVAIGQGGNDKPQGLVLEVPDGKGGWTVARPRPGLPRGQEQDDPDPSRRHSRPGTASPPLPPAHEPGGLLGRARLRRGPRRRDRSGRPRLARDGRAASPRLLAMTQADASSPELPHYDTLVEQAQILARPDRLLHPVRRRPRAAGKGRRSLRDRQRRRRAGPPLPRAAARRRAGSATSSGSATAGTRTATTTRRSRRPCSRCRRTAGRVTTRRPAAWRTTRCIASRRTGGSIIHVIHTERCSSAGLRPR